MNKQDIEHIFQTQINLGTDKIWFMLCDGDYKVIERHNVDDIENLVFTLDNFQYSGNDNNMPRFVK